MKKMELKNTTKMMKSSDYKERFKAEYYQLAIRRKNLLKVIAHEEKEILPFELSCPIEMLKEQAYYMEEYLRVLETRAAYENIDLY